MSVMHVAIYARYSSSEQDGTLTIESQVRACKEHALAQGMQLGEVYVDRGIAGSRDLSRPEFQRMISDAQRRPRPFEQILVWKYSRFFRDRHKSAVYKGLLQQYGVDVVSVTERVDKGTASGVLMEGMIEVIDQFYSARLSEETRRGLKENVLAGFRAGAVAPFGYRRRQVDVPGGRPKTVLVPDPAAVPIVRRIFAEYASGERGLKKIAGGLNEDGIPSARGGTWDPSAIRSMLKNEVYLGWAVGRKIKKVLRANDKISKIWNPREEWIVNKDAWKPIVESETWDAVVKQFAVAAPKGLAKAAAKSRGKYLLAGLIRCGECGGNYLTYKTRKRDRSWWYAYACGIRKRRGLAACSNRLEVPHVPFNRRIVENLIELLTGGDYLDEVAREVNEKIRSMAIESEPKLAEIRRELATINRKLELCVDAVLAGEFQRVKERMTRLEVREEKLRIELAELEAGARRERLKFSRGQVQAAQKAIVEELTKAEGDALRTYLLEIFNYITIYPSGKLVYNFKPEGLFPASATMHHGWYAAGGLIHVADPTVIGR